jgi:hypothetical protein
MAVNDSRTPTRIGFELDAETYARVTKIGQAIVDLNVRSPKLVSARDLLRVMTIMDGLSALALVIRAAVPRELGGMVDDLTTMAEEVHTLARKHIAGQEPPFTNPPSPSLGEQYADAVGYGRFIWGSCVQRPQ